MLRTQSSNACVAAMLPRLATCKILWRTQNLCLRAWFNNVAAFSQAQDRKADTFTDNVSAATLCLRLAGLNSRGSLFCLVYWSLRWQITQHFATLLSKPLKLLTIKAKFSVCNQCELFWLLWCLSFLTVLGSDWYCCFGVVLKVKLHNYEEL